MPTCPTSSPGQAGRLEPPRSGRPEPASGTPTSDPSGTAPSGHHDHPGGGDHGGALGGGYFDWGAAETDDGQPISPALFRQLLCDADVMRVIVDGPSRVLDVGRAERTATTVQRRALLIRDGGCVFPGCDRPPGWCEAHHIWWWEDGGPTDIDNLALACSHHHHLIHKGEFKMRREGNLFVFTRPDGTTIVVPVGASRARHRSDAYAGLRS